jgi:hypothetical protein
MSHTSSTSSWAVIFLLEYDKAGVLDVPLLAALLLVVFWEVVPLLTVLVSVVHIWEFKLGQLCPMVLGACI